MSSAIVRAAMSHSLHGHAYTACNPVGAGRAARKCSRRRGRCPTWLAHAGVSCLARPTLTHTEQAKHTLSWPAFRNQADCTFRPAHGYGDRLRPKCGGLGVSAQVRRHTVLDLDGCLSERRGCCDVGRKMRDLYGPGNNRQVIDRRIATIYAPPTVANGGLIMSWRRHYERRCATG